MPNWAKGKFTPKNPQKYVGKREPTYRSSWELAFMQFLDNNNHIISWASEAISIPYKNPLTGKNTIYVPDFFVLYENKFGQKVAEVVEIKPKKQSLMESKVSNAKDRAVIAINHAKWKAAVEFCRRQGLVFRVLTEENLFYNGRK